MERKYLIYAQFDTKRGKDYFVAEEITDERGNKTYSNMRGGLWYMRNVEVFACTSYKSLKSLIADILPLYTKPPFNARVIEPEYI